MSKDKKTHNKYYFLYNGDGLATVYYHSASWNEHKLIAMFKHGKDALEYVSWKNKLFKEAEKYATGKQMYEKLARDGKPVNITRKKSCPTCGGDCGQC